MTLLTRIIAWLRQSIAELRQRRNLYLLNRKLSENEAKVRRGER